MKNRLFLLLLLVMTFVHASIVVDPNCTINFGAGDAYISGGLQIDLVKDVPKYPTINFDPSSRLYFVGAGDADLTNVYVLHNATVDKPSGDLYLNSSLDITGNMDFSSGNIITGANTVTLNQISNGNLSGESATSYIVGTVVASRAIGTSTSTFGGIGFQINNTGSNLGTVTITRQAGAGNDINIYGSNGIERQWTVGTSVAFAGTRSVTVDWLSNEDNGNVLASLKAWKYEATKNTTSDENISSKKKVLLKSSSSKGIRSERELSGLIEDDINLPMIESDPKTLGWVEVDGAVFNTASSPRTSTFTIDAATIFTINDVLNIFADGSGTEANPYQIETLTQLDNVRNYLTACFIQIADIDATPTTTWDSGAGWTPISNFAGKYDGNGHLVSNLFIDRSTADYIALFGLTAVGCEIKDMGLENVDITGNDYVAAFVGRNNGDFLNCYSSGDVKPTGNFSGGFFGYTSTGTNILNCYSNTIVTRMGGTDALYIGGFGGRNYQGTVSNCYSTGSVHYDGSTDPTNKGFLGTIYLATALNNFWNTDTSGQVTSSAGVATGITTNEMRTLATFTDATWDFQDEDINGSEYIWGMNYAENNAFPFLSWQGITHDPISGFAGGMGTESEPYLISTPAELDNVRNFLGVSYDDTYFLQTADLDLSGYSAGEGWIPLGTDGTNSFRGNYEGDRNTISNLTIDRASNYQSLFGYMTTASVKNLGLENVNIVGAGYVGGIGSYLTTSSIEGCYMKGALSASSTYAGGIAAYLVTSSSISESFTSGSVIAPNYGGGITGRIATSSVIDNCYSVGTISRTSGGTLSVFGGISGYNNASKILNSYSAAQIEYIDAANPTNKGLLGGLTTGGDYEMVNNFWDTEVSGQSMTSGAGTGKTTSEMQSVATYTATATVGLTTPWDFVGDPNDDVATNDYWNIHPSLNGGYPYFEYEGRTPVLAPGNLALAYSAGDVTLTWDAVVGAAGYAVYSSDDPYGTFVLDGSGAFNGEEWTVTTADPKMFYFVTATNATKETPKVIKMNSSVADR